MSVELYLLLPEYLIKIQECSQCGELFKECANIGRHLCRIHPGIRLLTNDCIPQRAFYSCCGYSLQAKGCLQMDHSACSFSETDGMTRISQLTEFGTIIVPHLLSRFLTPPLPSSILYDTTKPTRERVFVYHFHALEEVACRTQKLTLTHMSQLVNYDTCPYETPLLDQEEVTTKRIDLVEEAHTLFQSGKDSPLFSRLMKYGASQTETALLAECENTWRSRLGNTDESSTTRPCAIGEQVPFMIIARINARLDVFLKIKK